MYQIPDDSIAEDEIPVKSYFKSKAAVSLDETVRNHGRANVEISAAQSEQSTSKTSSETPGLRKHQENTPCPDNTAQSKQNQESETHLTVKSVKPAPKSLSDAFSFIKDTEFYNEEDATKAVEQNRKRKIEDKSSSDKPEPPKKVEQPQV